MEHHTNNDAAIRQLTVAYHEFARAAEGPLDTTAMDTYIIQIIVRFCVTEQIIVCTTVASSSPSASSLLATPDGEVTRSDHNNIVRLKLEINYTNTTRNKYSLPPFLILIDKVSYIIVTYCIVLYYVVWSCE